ncbi:translation elongation factor G paralog [Vibrio ishigakensis]|uniref:Translation elongation factor G paralog n=1 Tax=Vibrio ishigakensis TaxID=1481914 RepID=A0A0B8PDI4_9VIBR|nr:translation elongation factor G paralog [Vibrio ishigakensis]
MLIETAVEQDDDLMMAYMEGEEQLWSKSKSVSVKVLVT